MSDTEVTQRSDELKKLDFVPKYGSKGVKLANDAYETAKAYVPESVKPTLEKVEGSVGAAAAPYVLKAQDSGNALLKTVDSKVDEAATNAQIMIDEKSKFVKETFEKQKEYHLKNMESYKAARDQYLKKVEDTVEFVKAKGVGGTARLAADEVTAALAEARSVPGILAKKVHEAFERMVQMDVVQKLLKGTRDYAQPAVQKAYQRYVSVHDGVVQSSSYKKLYDMSVSTVNQVQASSLYRSTAAKFYPYVAKYADPAFASITGSSKYQALVSHITPQPPVQTAN